MNTRVYKDPLASPENRAKDLLSEMTLVEKVAQLRALWLKLHDDGTSEVYDRITEQRAESQDALKDGIGHITRPFGTHPISLAGGARALGSIQKWLVEETRLGIPAIPHEECLSGFLANGATQFPSPLNFGATWNPDLIAEVAGVIGRQMASVGVRQGLAPVVDVVRDARWGRVEECIGEDPYLVGEMVTSYVLGLENGGRVIATLKHFAGHSFGEGGRNLAPVHVGPREFADIFLLPFEMAVKVGGAGSVMSAYHDTDGVPASASRELLTEILRERWGFRGTVVADYNIVRYLETKHRIAGDKAEAAAAAVNAGMDVELPMSEYFEPGLPEAVRRGLITEETIDIAVERVLRTKFALGLFEDPFDSRGDSPIEVQSDRALAREVAAQSLILLKNDGVLPLAADARKLALIGPNADEQMALFGNYNFPTNVAARFPELERPRFGRTIREALEERIGADHVSYALGCRILHGDFRRVRHLIDGPTPDRSARLISDDTSGIEAAGVAATAADVALVVVGDRAGHFQTGSVGEGSDADSLALPGVQRALVEHVLDTGTPTIVVVLSGRPYDLSWLDERAAAILQAWFPGQEGADAIVDALLGDINPSGKTTVTFPVSAGAQPLYYNHKTLSMGLPPLDHFKVVYPFGHGLSYTSFAYGDMTLSADRWTIGETIEVSVAVTNTGSRAGAEVVQLYIRDLVASIARPNIELKGFCRVELAPGETVSVRFGLHSDLLAFTGLDLSTIVEPGLVEIAIGASCKDIRCESTVEVAGKTSRIGQDRVFSPKVHVARI
jgi:beta-glucosidase-like glycosyl hydrolase